MSGGSHLDPEAIRLYQDAADLDPALWDDLDRVDPDRASLRTGAILADGLFRLELLGRLFTVDRAGRSITAADGKRVSFQEGLVLLVYLAGQGPSGLAGRRGPLNQLPGGAMFFTKAHAPATDELAAKINLDRDGFSRAGQALGGRPTGLGEASWLVLALPQIPLEAIFFTGDDEFPPRIHLLIDLAAHNYLDLGAIYGLINILAGRMKKAVGQAG